MKNAYNFLVLIMVMGMSLSSCYNEDNKIAITCSDGVLNNGEEFLDCGGPNCDPCPPSCFNGVLDWDDEYQWYETGIDCGGPCEEEGFFCCENGRWDNENDNDPTLNESWIDCKLDGLAPGEEGSNSDCPICDDCTNGVHDPGETIMFGGVPMDVIDCDDDPLTDCPPCSELCNDGLLNGLEGDCGIDCGGVCLNCSFNTQCDNGIQDSYLDDPDRSEEGIDCGGCACPPCADLCGDGIQNGTEEAIDCGGDFCVPCNDPTLCSDGILNGFEDEVDCYNGTDGASACPSCQDLCFDVILNGAETDTDCGGLDCPPCANEEMFMTYKVDGQFYESRISTITATRTVGDLTNPDQLVVTGGAAHSFTITLQDTDLAPMSFNTGIYLVNNTDFTLFNNCVLVDNDGLSFGSVTDPIGVTVDITEVQFTAPVPPLQPGGVIEGTFTGRVFAVGQGTKLITEGQFRAIFSN